MAATGRKEAHAHAWHRHRHTRGEKGEREAQAHTGRERQGQEALGSTSTNGQGQEPEAWCACRREDRHFSRSEPSGSNGGSCPERDRAAHVLVVNDAG